MSLLVLRRKRTRAELDAEPPAPTLEPSALLYRMPTPDRSASSSPAARSVRRKHSPVEDTLHLTAPADGLYDAAPVLKLISPLDAFAHGWSQSEYDAGRRLVRFNVKQARNILRVSADIVQQEDHREGDTVVSCIYRPETDECVITSVDIIYLLENLVDSDFEIEEKNRIRRNLEGFKPDTIAKDKAQCHKFYQRIMKFPNPQPRTIDKNIKVFQWKVLEKALNKIVSKYVSFSDFSVPPRY